MKLHWSILFTFVLLSAMLTTGPAALAAPERIVSTDGALTEIVHALGAGERLIGVDSTSLYPPQVRELPQIGYKRALSVEGILSLNPDLLLLSEDAGPDRVILQLEHSGMPLHRFAAEPSLDAVRGKVLGIAELLDKPEQGQALWQRIAREVTEARAAASRIEQPLRVLFVLGLNDRSPLVAGRNTHADTMIQLAGGLNVIDSFDGYKAISPEAVAMTGADLVLMMDQRNQATNAESLFRQPGFASLPAAGEQRLVKQDGLLMLGFGPRIGQAVRELHAAFYPPGTTRETAHAH